MRKDGISSEEIGKHFNISGSVNRYINLNSEGTSLLKQRIKLNENQIIEVIKMKNDGKSLRSIGKFFGTDHHTIKRIINLNFNKEV